MATQRCRICLTGLYSKIFYKMEKGKTIAVFAGPGDQVLARWAQKSRPNCTKWFQRVARVVKGGQGWSSLSGQGGQV